MKLLPIEIITYQSKRTKEELLVLLTNTIEPESKNLWRTNTNNSKPYKGKIDTNHFEIKRILSYRNSFQPIIKGKIIPDLSGTRIEIKMQLHTFAMVFMCIWMGIVAISCVAVIVALANGAPFHPAILIPFGMLFFGYAMTMGGFKYETKKSKAFFQSLFEAREVS